MQTNTFSISEGTPSVHVTRTMNCSIKEVFDHMIDADIAHLFPQRGDVAAILSTTVPTKDWQLGQARMMTFDGGTSVSETLLTYEPYRSVSYQGTHFTSLLLKQLLMSMDATWLFTDNGNNTTLVEVFYALVPTNQKRNRLLSKIYSRSSKVGWKRHWISLRTISQPSTE